MLNPSPSRTGSWGSCPSITPRAPAGLLCLPQFLAKIYPIQADEERVRSLKCPEFSTALGSLLCSGESQWNHLFLGSPIQLSRLTAAICVSLGTKKKCSPLQPKSLQMLKILLFLEEQSKFEKLSMQEKSQGEVDRRQSLCWAMTGTERVRPALVLRELPGW